MLVPLMPIKNKSFLGKGCYLATPAKVMPIKYKSFLGKGVLPCNPRQSD